MQTIHRVWNEREREGGREGGRETDRDIDRLREERARKEDCTDGGNDNGSVYLTQILPSL